MAKLQILAGATSQSVNVFIQSSAVTTGAGLTGLAFNTSGLIAYYTFTGSGTTATSITLATLSAVTSAYSSGGFKEISSTNMPGLYRLDLPNAVLASGNGQSVVVYLSGATNMAPCVLEIELTATNNQSTGFGLSNVSSNVVEIGGSAVSTSTAQLGVNLVNISGSAVSTSTAQLGTNVVNWGATAVGTIPPDVMWLRSGTAQAGGSSTITLDSGASATNSFYNNAVIFIRSGTGAGQTNIITGYVGSTKVATVGASWATNPSSSSVFTIAAFGPVQATVSGTVNANVTEWAGSNVATPNTAGVPLVDLDLISGAALSTSTAQLGVNAVNIAGHAATVDGNNLLQVDVVDIAGSAVSTSSAQLGVNVVSVAGAASNIKKNQALADFPFIMTDSTNHAPKTGLTVTGTVSLNGGAFGSLTNSVTETSNGWYQVNLAAADLNANTVALRFTATGADDRDITIVTQP